MPLTIEEAAKRPEVIVVIRKFIEDQREWAAEAVALIALTELLPPFGAERTWHVHSLGRYLLERTPRTPAREGRWFLRCKASSDTKARALSSAERRAADLAAQFGVPVGVAWRAVQRNVVDQCVALASGAADQGAAFSAAVDKLTRRTV